MAWDDFMEELGEMTDFSNMFDFDFSNPVVIGFAIFIYIVVVGPMVAGYFGWEQIDLVTRWIIGILMLPISFFISNWQMNK